jgi:hypothetical protein
MEEEQEDENYGWLDCTQKDLKSMGVEGWKGKAEERSVWAIILTEAPVQL